MDKHDKAWKCWFELMRLFSEKECYMAYGTLHIGKGCGGDFVKVIEKYL